MLSPSELQERFARVRVLVLDCDGVMTNNELIYDKDGDDQHVFHVRDGHGLVLLRSHGIVLSVITGRSSISANKRMQELKFSHIVERAWKKGAALRALCAENNYALDHICYMGDDINDIGAVRLAGVGVAVADAHSELIARADFVTQNVGGRGAVREVAEAILKAQGAWEPLMKGFEEDGTPSSASV